MPNPLLLCTDLDRTLLPNGVQPESPGSRERFRQFVEGQHITLVYVTGRDRSLVEQAIKCYLLPRPDLVISDVGSKIYDLRQDEWQIWPDWEKEIQKDWGNYTHTRLRELFRDLNALQMQEQAKQNTHKLSYYLSLHTDHEPLLAEMQRRLLEHGIKASLIWSIDEPAGIGLLDVLPASATKLHAIDFVRQQLGFDIYQTVFSGDSGNDMPVLTSAIPSILVANAAPTVRDSALAEARRADNGDALYIARGGSAESNGNYSAGILEGIAHYHPELF